MLTWVIDRLYPSYILRGIVDAVDLNSVSYPIHEQTSVNAVLNRDALILANNRFRPFNSLHQLMPIIGRLMLK